MASFTARVADERQDIDLLVFFACAAAAAFRYANDLPRCRLCFSHAAPRLF